MKKNRIVAKVIKKLAEGVLSEGIKKKIVILSTLLKESDPEEIPKLFRIFCKENELDLEQQALVLKRLMKVYRIHLISPGHRKQIHILVKKNPFAEDLYV